MGMFTLNIVMRYLEDSGLTFQGHITILLAGKHTTNHDNHMFGYGKSLLWYTKGEKPREGIPTKYIPNVVKSTVPEKLLHEKGWEQSPTEAEFIIEHLTFENEIVVDCMCGTGTTGIAALNLGRQFIGIDIDENECKHADARIRLGAQ